MGVEASGLEFPLLCLPVWVGFSVVRGFRAHSGKVWLNLGSLLSQVKLQRNIWIMVIGTALAPSQEFSYRFDNLFLCTKCFRYQKCGHYQTGCTGETLLMELPETTRLAPTRKCSNCRGQFCNLWSIHHGVNSHTS